MHRICSDANAPSSRLHRLHLQSERSSSSNHEGLCDPLNSENGPSFLGRKTIVLDSDDAESRATSRLEIENRSLVDEPFDETVNPFEGVKIEKEDGLYDPLMEK